MWFSNTLVYQFDLTKTEDLAAQLMEDSLKPCPPHARFIYGWLPAMGDELVQEVAGCALICMGKEERLLPRSVVHRMVSERINQLETQRGFSVKRAERAQMTEDIEFELLPKAFCVQKKLHALFDFVSKRLFINTSSATQASQLIALLRKSIQGLTIEPLPCSDRLAQHFAVWIQEPSTLPPNFQLASDCLLFSPEDDKKRFNCKGYELPAEEILTLLTQGLAPAEVSLIWNERIQFTLTQDLSLKRLKCLDYLLDDFNDLRQLDEEYQQQDAALTLLAGELRGLVNDLMQDVHQTSNSVIKKEAEELVE